MSAVYYRVIHDFVAIFPLIKTIRGLTGKALRRYTQFDKEGIAKKLLKFFFTRKYVHSKISEKRWNVLKIVIFSKNYLDNLLFFAFYIERSYDFE